MSPFGSATSTFCHLSISCPLYCLPEDDRLSSQSIYEVAVYKNYTTNVHFVGITMGLYIFNQPIPMSARSEVQFRSRSPAEIVGSKPIGSLSVVCNRVENSGTNRSLVQSSPNDCGVCVIQKPREWRSLVPLGAVASKTNKKIRI